MLLKEHVLNTVRRYRMLDEGDRVLVAVSGGPDSMALLHLLIELSRELSLALYGFHLDHRLRPESAEDALFVKARFEEAGIPLESTEYDLPGFIERTRLSVEDAARRVRYALLDKAADKVSASRIALGHQADDQVETFMMRILRGAGLAGLSAIPPVRDRFIRPLIETDRVDILEFLSTRGIRYRTDASNEDTSFLRNKVRARLIPELTEMNPAFKEVALNTIELIKEDEAFLTEEAGRAYARTASEGDSVVRLVLGDLLGLAPAIRRRVLRLAVEQVKGDLLNIEFRHIRLLMEGAAAGSLLMDLPGGLKGLVEGTDLLLGRGDVLGVPELAPLELRIPGTTNLDGRAIEAEIVIPSKAIDRDPAVAQLDYDLLQAPLIARGWKPGDFFHPLGLGGTKKIQDFFTDLKIPRRLRAEVPIVESAGAVVWVGGLRIDDHYKVTDKTKRVLILRLLNSKAGF
ncbi:MAG: tRNA lysidine(34) synthetase TilS [Candidatus Aquicultorales bacterium]